MVEVLLEVAPPATLIDPLLLSEKDDCVTLMTIAPVAAV